MSRIPMGCASAESCPRGKACERKRDKKKYSRFRTELMDSQAVEKPIQNIQVYVV